MSGAENVAAAPSRPAARSLLLVTCLSTLVVNANTSAVSILLPAISRDVDAPLSTLQWAVTGYSLVGAAVIVTAGVLGDLLGRRRVFLWGLALFIASCVWIALSANGVGIVLGRAVQGAAGSTIIACGLTLLTLGTAGSGRVGAISLWGAASAVGAAAGPLIGGALAELSGWQGLFWLDAALAAICIPITLRAVAESRDAGRSGKLDITGSVLIAAVLAPFVLAVTKGGDWGWASPATLGSFLVSIVAAVAFFYAERRAESPLVAPELLRNRLLMAGTLGILIGAGTVNALGYLVSLYFQDPATLGMSPMGAGLATLPLTVTLVLVSPTVVGLARRLGTRVVVGAGFAISTVGFVLLVPVDPGWGYALFVVPLVAVAAGLGLSNGPCSSLATSAVPESEVGAGSGISNMARYIGASVLVAVVAAVYGNAAPAADADHATSVADQFSRANAVLAVISALGVALAVLAARHRPERTHPADYAAAAVSSAHTMPSQAMLRRDRF
ncbi:MFS transporter [Cryptosporangium aurantiacum]|uniref:Major Facilitator Superfamily protein n=1 Tax=Cryptosporangium aurantiacum TaxID=134849 RepID=A0A1M7RG12_9ACTN|nr:MFS transporter [Cryptosporangium aurantiacum]SHN45102.1 Major Facilitator Superfamily protein [Cryptosporangium aurantiacum]